MEEYFSLIPMQAFPPFPSCLQHRCGTYTHLRASEIGLELSCMWIVGNSAVVEVWEESYFSLWFVWYEPCQFHHHQIPDLWVGYPNMACKLMVPVWPQDSIWIATLCNAAAAPQLLRVMWLYLPFPVFCSCNRQLKGLNLQPLLQLLCMK